jgi:hypothetical protein
MLIGAQVAGNVYNSFLAGGSQLTLQQWQSFWWIPAGFAAVVMILFAALFRDRVDARTGAEDEAVPVAAQPGAS